MAAETIGTLLRSARERLASGGLTDTPYLDALLLLMKTTGASREKLLCSLPDPIDGSLAAQFSTLIEKRRDGTPVAYLTGKREFWGRDFFVDERVLIPRPDTELLIEKSLELFKAGEIPEGRILDLCSGSGCIGITLQSELPGETVLLADISGKALEVSSRNSRNILGTEMPSFQSDLLEHVPGTFSLILSNPPYIADEQMRGTELISRGEPARALAAGPDGLDLYRRLLPQGFAKLCKKGYLMVECGADQADALKHLFAESGFEGITVYKDLGGRDRAVAGSRI